MEEESVALAEVPGGGSTTQGDHPDPFLLIDGDRAWVYSTNHAEMHVPVGEVSPGGVIGPEHDALPTLPAWSEPNYWFNWAPSVLKVPGGYVMYYAALDVETGDECISVATATQPAGPFTDSSTEPIICPPHGGGAIDASPVARDGALWLVWTQRDGGGKVGSIWSQRLADDGRTLVAGASQLLVADRPWEEGVVEAPSMVHVAGRWYLAYAGSRWTTGRYATGLAVCDSPAGPCTKAGGGPQIDRGAGDLGPGGMELTVDAQGTLWSTYHSWASDGLTWGNGGVRVVHLRRAGIVDGRLLLR